VDSAKRSGVTAKDKRKDCMRRFLFRFNQRLLEKGKNFEA
jgi:hypothetical protein